MATSDILFQFLGGVAQGRRDKHKFELEKAQAKLMSQQIKMKEKALEADRDFIAKLAGTPGQEAELGPIPFGGGPPELVSPEVPGIPGQDIRALLSTPQGQALALQSGRISTPELLKDQALANKPNLSDLIMQLQDQQGATIIDPVSALVAQQTGDIKQLKSVSPKFDTIQTQDGPRIKGINPLTGQELFDVGEEKAPNVSAEQAGKLEMLNQAVTDIDKAVEILLPGGQVDKKVLFQMQAPGGGIGKGRAARSLFRNAMNAKLRAETGAQANPSELDDMEKRFMPSPLDLTSPGLVDQKIQRLREFMEGALDISTLPASLKGKIEKRRNKEKPAGRLTPEQEARRQELLRKAGGAN